jgi:uncharacterized membrane protein YvlD (DUF360 family)
LIKLLARTIISLLANSVGLIAASLILDGFEINGVSFVVAVIIFSLSTVILSPLILKITIQNANYLIGGIALITTLVGLIITDVFTDGLSISGFTTWILATLIVWVFSIIANLILPIFLFKKALEKTKS